jgi:glyoxylase-like metal-dependent hydrolase (beta-lactamase superfamily II)
MAIKTPGFQSFVALSVLLAGCQGDAARPVIGTAAELQVTSLAAMHADNLTRLEFTASGWEGCLGQAWNINEGWARWELTDYRRVIDYSTTASIQTAQRRAAMDPDKVGGCGAQADAEPVPQQSSITSISSWPNQLPLWLTPQGFLQLAAQNGAAVAATADGWTASFTTTQNGVAYPMAGFFNDDVLLQRIETRLDNSVYGDMLVEAEFSDYRDFDGLLFPATLVQKQGGFPVLNLEVASVTPNTTASAEAPARSGGAPGGGGGAQAPQTEAVTQVAPGIFVSNGAYQSVFVEMTESIVVIDGLQNDARSAELITQAKAAIPGKPIRYVISTHSHFDHASGLRAFVAEGATIITHKTNEEFFKTALANPRTLENVDPQAVPVNVLGVGDYFVLSDPTRQIQLHRLRGSVHADDMLIAYLPEIKTVVEADMLQPWIDPRFAGSGPGPNPFLVHLAEELDRLQIDYTQFIPIHRPPQPPFMRKEDLMNALAADRK